jgi:hypothetical protein
MTKARARIRAKAKAAQKAEKRAATASNPEKKTHPGQFDPGTSSIKRPQMNANPHNSAGAKWGAARSR